MGNLTRWVVLAAALLVVSCATSGPPGTAGTVEQEAFSPVLPPSVPEASRPPRPQGPGPTVLLKASSPAPSLAAPWELLRVSPLDLENWPFGWVSDPEGPRLGRSLRFWSDSKPLWNQALASSLGEGVGTLEAIYRTSNPSEEAIRAAWRLWLAYSKAGLGADARAWLDRVREAVPDSPLVILETAWDQRFRLDDPEARRWWPRGGLAPPADEDRTKAVLLRQKLFLGAQGLEGVGADNFVSTLVLDRDDLWIGTWNGAVVRWSLVTGELTRLWKPDQVAPVTRLVPTRWFIYAFQDKGLLRYSKVTGAWRAFDYPPGWTGLRVTGALASEDEVLDVAYLGQGLWRWERGEWKLLDSGGGGPFVTALGKEAEGWLVGTKDRGLWTYRDGLWSPVPARGPAPSNISVLARSPEGVWAVGTWGEGAWVYDGLVLQPVFAHREFVTSAAWDEGALWGVLDQGLVWAGGGSTLGPRDGVGAEVTGLVVWEGKWLWGTGQGVVWWNEYENPALPR